MPYFASISVTYALPLNYPQKGFQIICGMASVPWRFIMTDADGVSTIFVNNDDLSSFPKFMHFVLKEKIGLKKGYFKVAMESNIQACTTLSELLSYIENYFKTKVPVPSNDIGGKSKWDFPSVDEQSFFYGDFEDHLYGFRTRDLSEKAANYHRSSFLRKIKNSTIFSTETMCMKMLEQSLDSLLQHYWSVIRSASEISTGMEFEDNEVDIEQIIQKAKVHRCKYTFKYQIDDECEKDASVCHEKLEDNSGSSGICGRHSCEIPILYACGIPVKDKDFTITRNFSLSCLGTVLDESPQKMDGIVHPFLYVGTEYASFPWHIEDGALFSINYLHYGAPCIWFFTQPEYFKAFTEWSRYFYLDPAQVTCIGILGGAHKYIIASKEFLKKLGIPVDIVIQRPGEIIVAYPFTPHSGFKTGWNIQESVNFADEWWVEPAVLAPPCPCFPFTVHMDLTAIIAVFNEDLARMYAKRNLLGLMKAVSGNAFVKRLGLVPSSAYDSIQKEAGHRTTVEVVREAATDVIEEYSGERSNANTVSSAPSNGGGSSSFEASLRTDFKGARFPLECPHEKCDKMYEGGRSKIPRLQKHIEDEHGGDLNLLLKLRECYPPKKRKSKSLLCFLCGETKAGGIAQLKMHIRRKHPGYVI